MMEREKQIIGALIIIIMVLLVVTTYSLTINLQPQNQTHKGSVANLTGNNTTLNSTAVTSGNSNDNGGNDEKTFPGPHGEGSYHVGDVVDDHDNLMQLQSDGQWVKIGVAEHNDKPDTSSNNDKSNENQNDYQESSSSSDDKYLSSDDYYVSDAGFVISKDHPRW